MELRAQVGFEYLIVTGILLTFLIAAYAYSQTTSTDILQIEQAKDTVRKISTAADRIFAIGPNSKTLVAVTVPQGASGLYITGNSVALKVNTSSGETDVFQITNANVTGNVPLEPGTHQLLLEVDNNGTVKISKVA